MSVNNDDRGGAVRCNQAWQAASSSDRYRAQSPLDRCQLRDDIEKLLEAYPWLITLGIDFDLSPALAPVDNFCADRILSMLQKKFADSPNREFRAVVITPIGPVDRTRAWPDKVQSHQVMMAPADLHVEMGMVQSYVDSKGGAQVSVWPCASQMTRG